MRFIPYNKDLIKLSKELRNNSTLSEILLWKHLRAGQMKDYTFNRQKPLLNYIVDFYCSPLNLIIEIDGNSHDHKFEADKKRQDDLENQGLFFLRFDDKSIKKDIENVLRTIEIWIEDFEKNPPNPFEKWGIGAIQEKQYLQLLSFSDNFRL
jgi:very-short-patch-repair endonuclease